nr:MAG TPA: hypothetical protein [Inoviridae sp.]
MIAILSKRKGGSAVSPTKCTGTETQEKPEIRIKSE